MPISESVVPGQSGHAAHHNALAQKANELDTLVTSGRLSEPNLSATIGDVAGAAAADNASDLAIAIEARIAALAVSKSTASLNVLNNGVSISSGADQRAAIQAVLNAAATWGIREVYFPAGTYLIRSATVTGATGYALVVPKGVSIRGAGSDQTVFDLSGVNANLFMIASVLSTTAVATITANSAVKDTTFTVDSSAGFSVGDLVAARIGQNSSDIAEAKQAVIVKVTAIPDSTHLTIDTPAEWSANAGTIQAVNRRFTKIDSLMERMSMTGFHIKGSTNLRHGIGVQWARHLRFQDITGEDVGSGIINAQWCDNVSARDIYVYRCGAYGNSSKGRGISLSNVRNFNILNFTADYCEGAQLYIESYSIGVRVDGFLIKNRATSRSVQYMIFCGYECDTFVDGLTVTDYDPATPTNDSVVSYGAGTGQIQFHNTTLYMEMQYIRAFPTYACSGYLRLFDNSGNLRTFNLNKVERSTVEITLVAGSTLTAWLRDGLHIGYEVYVAPGVDNTMLTSLTIGRTFVASSALSWTAGSMVRSDAWLGGSTWPMPSAFAQGSKVTATIAAGASLPAGARVIVTLYSINYNGYATIGNEPGSEQRARFLPYFSV